MIKRMNPELLERRKKLVTDYLALNDQATASELKEILHFPRSTASLFLTRLRNLGHIYRTGPATSPRYWLSESRYLAWVKAKEDAEIEKLNTRTRKRAFKVCEPDHLIYLSKKRPAGINTIFDECKHNSQILPVLQVMARRLYG